MIAATIGRKFLAQYNQQNRTDLSAKAFFETICFPLFYGHPKYLQWVGNSPFVQMKKNQKPHLLTTAERLEKLENLAQKIDDGDVDASTAIGYPASEASEFATTSGQVTDLAMAHDEETVYCSWIGGGFGVGVAGGTGQILLFDQPDILNALFDGWQHYRDFLNDPAYDNLPGNKINSWNGQWLSHAMGERYKPHSPLRDFTEQAFVSDPNKEIEIKPQSWLTVLLAIANRLPLDSLMVYIYKMGQTNSTYGFIPFQLDQLQRPEQLYIKLFGDGDYQRDKTVIRTIYGTAQSFQRICQMGAIGVSALEPKGLRDVMVLRQENPRKIKYSTANEIPFNVYQTWLLAMLNTTTTDVWDNACQAADLLLRYETFTKPKANDNKDLSTNRNNEVDAVLSASSREKFMTALVPIMKESDASMKDELEVFALQVHRLPRDNFSYFMTLVKLRYAKLS